MGPPPLGGRAEAEADEVVGHLRGRLQVGVRPPEGRAGGTWLLLSRDHHTKKYDFEPFFERKNPKSVGNAKRTKKMGSFPRNIKMASPLFGDTMSCVQCGVKSRGKKRSTLGGSGQGRGGRHASSDGRPWRCRGRCRRRPGGGCGR